MNFTGLGGGIMVVLAAGLWLVYLMPSLFKRREYVAVERTEVRRQQAMRVLQETAPIPAVVRAKAIVSPAGEVTDREKLAEAIKRSKDAQAAREAGRKFVSPTNRAGQAASAKARMSRRLRRTRATAALILLVAIATVVVQVVLMVSTGIVPEAWAVLGFGAVVGVVSVSALGRLANMARRRAAVPAVEQVAARPARTRVAEKREDASPVVTTWTPVAIPKPVYLSRSEAPAAPIADPLEQLRAAARESDRALREAQESPEVTPIPQRAAAASEGSFAIEGASRFAPEPDGRFAPEPVSRFASMGIVENPDIVETDLDEVLRRRRQSA